MHLNSLGWAVVLLLAATSAAAQEPTDQDKPVGPGAAEPPTAEAADTEAEELRAIVRGLFLEARVGGGYMIVDQGPEQLAGTYAVTMALGYDIFDFLALQVVGGAILAEGRRPDDPHVRDLSLLHAGVGARVYLGLSDRFFVVLAASGGFVWADNAVDPVKSGLGIEGTVGIEYFVHIRHFSVGLDVMVMAPINPVRVYLGVSPTVKYSFF